LPNLTSGLACSVGCAVEQAECLAMEGNSVNTV